MQPTLLNSCARAATAAEARFRIDRPIAGRSARVVALDEEATEVVRRVSEQPWNGARFFTSEGGTSVVNGNSAPADIVLRAIDGSESRLSDELVDTDVVIVIATSDDGAPVASAIARACVEAGVMMAGLILGERHELGAAVSALRPYAPVLMVTGDEDDVTEVLTALRA
jgi:predicted amino acid dehydrogenase